MNYRRPFLIGRCKRIGKSIRCQLDEKQENCERLKPKVVFLRRALDKTYDQLKFVKSAKIIDSICICKIFPFDKTKLGYNRDQNPSNESSSSTVSKNEEEPKSYVANLKDSIDKEENNKNITNH